MSLGLRQYAQLAIDRGAVCSMCGTTLTKDGLGHYPHPGGWPVDGMAEPQWLYLKCPRTRCGYSTSFKKLHIDK